VTGLAAQVTAALERSVLPSVIARGGAVRVAAAGDGVVTLEVTGSPGAVFPLASRIEAVIRAAGPAITAVRLITPGTRPAGPPPAGTGDLAGAARAIIDAR
jgi:Fe-S cluster biogenesis protein NfuA